MTEDYPKFKVAAVQASPVFLKKGATIDKACALIAEAANNGAELIVFPEAFIPTYPYWLPEGPGLLGTWAYSWRNLLKSSVEVPSPDTERLCQAARKANAHVVMGLNERDHLSQGTIYNTMLFIDREGGILGSHRKLIPTLHERLYWGRGDGSGMNVYNTDLGGLSGLICAENLMTLSKYILFSQGEQIHCATFPGWGGTKLPEEDTPVDNSIMDVICPALAREGQVWVVISCGYLTEKDIPSDFPHKRTVDFGLFGGSGIVSPRGHYVAGPVYGEETIVYGEIDMGLIPLAKCAVDGVGHYARWDVANLNFNKQPHLPYTLAKRQLQSSLAGELAELEKALGKLTERLRENSDPDLTTALEDVQERFRVLQSAQPD